MSWSEEIEEAFEAYGDDKSIETQKRVFDALTPLVNYKMRRLPEERQESKNYIIGQIFQWLDSRLEKEKRYDQLKRGKRFKVAQRIIERFVAALERDVEERGKIPKISIDQSIQIPDESVPVIEDMFEEKEVEKILESCDEINDDLTKEAEEPAEDAMKFIKRSGDDVGCYMRQLEADDPLFELLTLLGKEKFTFLLHRLSGKRIKFPSKAERERSWRKEKIYTLGQMKEEARYRREEKKRRIGKHVKKEASEWSWSAIGKMVGFNDSGTVADYFEFMKKWKENEGEREIKILNKVYNTLRFFVGRKWLKEEHYRRKPEF